MVKEHKTKVRREKHRPLHPAASGFCASVHNLAWATMPYADRQIVDNRLGEVAAHETGHAVVLACCGYLPTSIKLFRKQPIDHLWTGLTVADCEDPATSTIESMGLAEVIRFMCATAGGYAGEKHLYRDTLRSTPELGIVMWVSLIMGWKYDISPETLLRATLQECERCLVDNEDAARGLMALLIRKREADQRDIAALLGNVTQRTTSDWVKTARTPNAGDVLKPMALLRTCARLHGLETSSLLEAEQLLQKHGKVVLQISGGKDSLACLYLLRPFWDQLTVLWGNTGAAFPETLALMERIKSMVPHFIEVKSDQPGFVQVMGMPADIVPVCNSAVGKLMQPNDGVLLQGYWECCAANLWHPMQKAVDEIGATLIIRGQRADEKRKAPIQSGHVEAGVTIWFPIQEWTERDVFDYLRARAVEIPKHYEYTKTSLDCWSCTALLDENQGKLRYMREKHPELWQQLAPRLRQVRDAAHSELAFVDAALAIADENPDNLHPPKAIKPQESGGLAAQNRTEATR